MTTPITTTTSGITQRSTTYAVAKMLSHAAPVMVLEKSATNVDLPKNKGAAMKFRRPNVFTAATTPLVEGVTPTGRQFTYTDVSATLKQYGDYSFFTDQIVDLHEDNVGSDISEQHGANIGRTNEALDWGTLKGGTSVNYANGGAQNAVNTPISLDLIRKATTLLNANKADRFTQVMKGSADYATFPIQSAFIGYAHTDLESDLRNIPGFIPVAAYGSMNKISDHEVGSTESVRWILSPDLTSIPDVGGAIAGTSMYSTTGTLADVYPAVIVGKEFWARVKLRGREALDVKVKQPGTISTDDPLGQRGIVSWKMYHVSLITNDAWGTRLEVARTAL